MLMSYRNVNDAFGGLVGALHDGTLLAEVRPSRAGEVMVVPHPVLVSYSHPWQRVLFNTARDANPFFHLFESLWMLAGRNDVAPLAHYNSRIADIASDDGIIFNGAYGYRWREGRPPRLAMPVDQLDTIVWHLTANPYSRRAVLAMWDVADDLTKIDTTKDVCCNTHAYFSIEPGDCPACNGTGARGRWAGGTQAPTCPRCNGLPHDQPAYLNMTVCNRSNDLIWGLLGANAVHFSMLQEYIATRLNLHMGIYYQFTNNLHVYTERWQPQKWLEAHHKPMPCQTAVRESYEYGDVRRVPLVQDPYTFDKECEEFIDNRDWSRKWQEPFLQNVAAPMCWAYYLHKARDYTMAKRAMALVEAEDWRIVGLNWLIQRQAKWEAS